MAARSPIIHDESNAETLLIRENILCIVVVKEWLLFVKDVEECYRIGSLDTVL